MKKNGNRKRDSALPRVQTIELRDGNKWKTAVVVFLLLAIGLFFLGRGVKLALTRQGGWTEIQVQGGSSGCAAELEFQYLLDQQNGNAEYRSLVTLYTEGCQRADKVYSSTATEAGLGNLAALNREPNRELRLEPELYRALEKVRDSGNRTLYLAPLYEYYTALFFCEREEETLEYDPLRNPELAGTFAQIAAFAGDPAQIELELLGEDRACLRVSREYLDWAAENGFTVLVDFGWMKNAFILDDLAEAVRAQGFTRGYLQSAEGFGCNLCDTGDSYALNVFDRACPGDGVVAQMCYDRPICFLSLHSYTRDPVGNDFYYEMADGEVRSIYVDPSDGLPRTALDDLLVWSSELSCGELALGAGGIFSQESFDPESLESLGCSYLYCSGRLLICNDPTVRIPLVAEGYRLQQAA